MSHRTGSANRDIDLRDDASRHRTQVIDTRQIYVDDSLTMAQPPVGATVGGDLAAAGDTAARGGVGGDHALRDVSAGTHPSGNSTGATPVGAGDFGESRVFDVDWYADDEQPPQPRRGFGGPFGPFVALLVSAGVATLAVIGPSLPAHPGVSAWTALQGSLDVTSAASLPSWWSVVLFTLTAVWCWTAAGRARLGRRWLRLLLWGLLGLVVLALSLSNLLSLRNQITDIAGLRRWGMPHYVVAHPLDAVLAVALAIPVLLLMIGTSGSGRTLMMLGVVLYIIGSFVVGGGGWHVSPQAAYQQAAQVSFEWCGMVLLMLAAGIERVRPRPRRRRRRD